MIKSLEIRNFQSHKQSLLEFSKGVNIIIGATDSGKSAIIRALKWLVWNRPTGDEFRSYWEGDTAVGIELFEGLIERHKTNNDNIYLIDEAVFKAFGTEVPEEIQDVLNLEEVNLQQQLDSSFLLSNTPGEVAQYFNQIAHLEPIDIGTRNIQKWIKAINQDITSKEQQITEQKEQLTTFEYLDKFEVDLEVLEETEIKLKTKLNAKNNLNDLITEINEINVKITYQSELLKPEDKVNELLSYYKELNELQTNFNHLCDDLDYIAVVDEDLKELDAVISVELTVKRLLKQIELKKEAEKNLNKLKELIQDIKLTNCAYTTTIENLNMYQNNFDKAFPDICPLCGKPK